MTASTISKLRKMTRLALPEDDSYIVKLGIATYSFASIVTFLAENMCYLGSGIDRNKLQAKEAGKILEVLKSIQNKRAEDEITADIQFVVDNFSDFKNLRNDILHATCITGSNNKQVLYRSYKGRNFAITESFLDSFIVITPEISNKLYSIRDHVWGTTK